MNPSNLKYFRGNCTIHVKINNCNVLLSIYCSFYYELTFAIIHFLTAIKIILFYQHLRSIVISCDDIMKQFFCTDCTLHRNVMIYRPFFLSPFVIVLFNYIRCCQSSLSFSIAVFLTNNRELKSYKNNYINYL